MMVEVRVGVVKVRWVCDGGEGGDGGRGGDEGVGMVMEWIG